ncbi:MAG: large conductance mechanosensitive channel protein MscL [Nitriliruptorales bacterium]|nr:large conductance mechanosensitive channel protein MscL [Nitriliruptorales bacterium]
MIREFRDFVNRGNFVDIAVAFVIGAAFGAVTTALTGRVVTPLIALVFDVPDLDNMWTFGETDPATGQPAGSFGAFVGALINFLIVAFVMFLVVKAYNTFRGRHEEPEPEGVPAEPDEVTLLREIRDALQEERR